MKIGIVVVGGGLRGIYAAGVLDYCMDQGIHFDVGIGVSAGSANLSSYIAGQKWRNYQFYTEYAFRKQYMSLENFIRKKSYVDLDYIYGTLSKANGENPLDYSALCNNPMEFYVVATDSQAGMSEYFDKTDMHQDDYNILKASCSIPFVCKPYIIHDKPYFDGALADPVPIEKAFQLGCDRVVLILTKPEKEVRTSKKDEMVAIGISKKYPVAAEKLSQRAQKYNESVALAKEYAGQGKVLIVAPDDTCGVDTLKKDKESMQRLFDKGYGDGEKILDYLKKKD